MEIENDQIDVLIIRYLTGHANPSEISRLESWMNGDNANRKIVDRYRKAWHNCKSQLAKVQLDSDLQKIKELIITQTRARKDRSILFMNIYRAAAILIIPLLIGFGWYLGRNKSTENALLTEMTAPKGQVANCILSDGTKVWLNSGTTIQYDPSFSGKNRIVNLTGEAYFEVTRNPRKPFIVSTEKLNVEVVGTSFNFKAYPGNESAEVTLEEGSVELSFVDIPNQIPVSLEPGEHAVYDQQDKNLKIEKTETYLFTAWRDGKYIFRDADLKTIIRHLELLYDVRIHASDIDINQFRFRGTFESNQKLPDALETLERISSCKYTMKGRDVLLEKSNKK